MVIIAAKRTEDHLVPCCASLACPRSVRRYRCRLLVGLSGRVISIRPVVKSQGRLEIALAEGFAVGQAQRGLQVVTAYLVVNHSQRLADLGGDMGARGADRVEDHPQLV